MANTYISKCLRRLASNTNIIDLHSFWDLIDRKDLRNATEYEHLRGAPNYQTLLYEAKRVINKRNSATAGKAEAVKPPGPLTQFMLAGDNYGDHEVRYFTRRPTKGWRWMILNSGEVAAYKKQGVCLLKEMPQVEIRKRRVA